MEEADHLRHHEEVNPIYAKRKNDGTCFRRCKRKAWHALDNVKGLKKLSMQAMLTFAAMNLKKMANWNCKVPKYFE